METASIRSNDGVYTIYHNGNAHTITPDHVNYERIEEVLSEERYDELEELFDVPTMIARHFDEVEVDEDGQVYYNGQIMHNALSRRITQYCREGIPFDSLVRFFQNLMKNPSKRAVDELYSFLDNQEMPITQDGCFVGYKAVTSDWKDKHTRTIDNSIGTVVSIPRNEVDDDPNNTCSKGLHVANHNYATGFAHGDDNLVLVKVNPMDCVSVPNEYGAEKLRCCRYVVLARVEKKLDDQAMYQEAPIHSFDFEDEEEDFYNDLY
jgi:hypothetical protein